MSKKNVQSKRCPRCKEKCSLSEPTCSNCGLVFARLTNTSNKEGKKALIRFKRNEYFLSPLWPEDVKRYKALLWCGFLGLVGAHNFYLGRYFKAIFSLLIVTLVTLIFSFIPNYKYYDIIMGIIGVPGAFAMIFWFYDFIMIAIGKYRIPVALKKAS